MEKFKTVPITLITGYLGSGKTTLINHILKNAKNHKIAVIVNDIGEVNIDADLIANGGVVSQEDDNLVALSNGCICCTLKKDLINQLADLVNSGKFDYILIEASGICEPVPIAQTISYMEAEFDRQKLPKFYTLDSIISVTDAMRLVDEFGCGETLNEAERGEENLENLVIQQLEFCDIVLLNKVSEISKEELRRVKMAIKAIQPEAKIIECDYCDVDIDELVDNHLFDFDKAAGSAAWIREFEDWDNEVEHHEEEEHHHHDHDEDDDDEDEHEHEHHHEHEHEHEEHEHHHHHHHHHHHGIENEEEGTALEYDINTFVYYRRRAFDDQAFAKWVEESPKHHIIRAKGICYFTNDEDNVYIYESAGRQRTLNCQGKWLSATLNEKQLKLMVERDENFAHDWDETYKDRLIKLVFIGQNLDEEAIRKELDRI
ncbi:MAG: GTP-binding protein [Bacilli bacterium]|nr:GTP-binding protein [Bacilli bacterium]